MVNYGVLVLKHVNHRVCLSKFDPTLWWNNPAF